jgi:predicted O-methyltransferase YrrM
MFRSSIWVSTILPTASTLSVTIRALNSAALQILEQLADDNKKFDFFFIDAGKKYDVHLKYCIKN